MKKIKPKNKRIKNFGVSNLWVVMSDGRFVSDGSERLAVYFTKNGAKKWRREMLGDKDKNSKIVPCFIKLLT